MLLERIAVGGMAEIFLARKDGLNGFFDTLSSRGSTPSIRLTANSSIC